jgi:hypothetical protein
VCGFFRLFVSQACWFLPDEFLFFFFFSYLAALVVSSMRMLLSFSPLD